MIACWAAINIGVRLEEERRPVGALTKNGESSNQPNTQCDIKVTVLIIITKNVESSKIFLTEEPFTRTILDLLSIWYLFRFLPQTIPTSFKLRVQRKGRYDIENWITQYRKGQQTIVLK